MINYLKSETERLEKRIKRITPYVDFYGQIPTLTKSNNGEFFEYLKLNQELSTLIKTSWIFARKELEILKKCGYTNFTNYEEAEDSDYAIEYKETIKCKEIISYCEAKAKEHKIELNSQQSQNKNGCKGHRDERPITNDGEHKLLKTFTYGSKTADTLRGLEDGE